MVPNSTRLRYCSIFAKLSYSSNLSHGYGSDLSATTQLTIQSSTSSMCTKMFLMLLKLASLFLVTSSQGSCSRVSRNFVLTEEE